MIMRIPSAQMLSVAVGCHSGSFADSSSSSAPVLWTFSVSLGVPGAEMILKVSHLNEKLTAREFEMGVDRPFAFGFLLVFCGL